MDAWTHQGGQDVFAVEGGRGHLAPEGTAVAGGEMHVVFENDLPERPSEEDLRADRGDLSVLQHPLRGLEPPRGGDGVVVQEGDDVSSRRGDAGVHPARETLVLGQAEHAHPVPPVGGGRPGIGAVVDQDDLVSLSDNRVEAPCQPFGRLEGDDDD